MYVYNKNKVRYRSSPSSSILPFHPPHSRSVCEEPQLLASPKSIPLKPKQTKSHQPHARPKKAPSAFQPQRQKEQNKLETLRRFLLALVSRWLVSAYDSPHTTSFPSTHLD